jgi:His-Xaa-Ser system protein HxsD
MNTEQTAPQADSQVDSLRVRFALDVFDLETIKKAAYRLGDRCTVDITLEGQEIVCGVHPLPKVPADVVATLPDDLRTEVLDQDLRRTVALETTAIRNSVLAYAFSRTGLQDSE